MTNTKYIARPMTDDEIKGFLANNFWCIECTDGTICDYALSEEDAKCAAQFNNN